MRRSALLVTVLAVTASCGAAGVAGSPSAPEITAPSPARSPTPTAPVSPTASPSVAIALPAGVPPSYSRNSEPGDVPLEALVPAGASATGSWFPDTGAGSAAILVSYSQGADPFHRINGLVEWVRFTARPFWRATYGVAYPAASGVLGIAVQLGDATGDASTDALVLASTGGSGNCGIWSVIDISASAQVFDRSLCDATITFSRRPVGLTLAQSVFRPTDPHCCPSSTRVSVLTWNGSAWSLSSQETVSASPP